LEKAIHFMKKAHIVSRLAFLGLIALLLALTCFSIWSATITRRESHYAALSVHVSDLYDHARYYLDLEHLLADEYQGEQDPALLAKYTTAANSFITTLQAVERDGPKSDQALALQVLSEHKSYLSDTNAIFTAVVTGNRSQVATSESKSELVLERIKQQLKTAVDAYHTQVLQSTSELDRTQSMVFTATPVVFATGLFLIAACWMVIGFYRRKINEAMQSELERLEWAALTDSLTDLGNHRAYQEDIQHAWELARPAGKMVGLALIDVDEFKMINDEYGYLYGDRLLTDLASLLREVNTPNRAYRLSADKFAMILPHTCLTNIVTAMEHLRQDAEQCLFGTTVSIGVAITGSGEGDADTLQEQADAALSEAKRSSRNVVVTFEDVQESVPIVSTAKIRAVRRLLSERKLTVAFQPIWDLAHGTILAFEALVRPAAEYGLAGPQEAFDISEKIGHAHELDSICVRAVLARAKDLPPDVLLFINLSPQTLDHDLLAESVLQETILSAGLTLNRVVLELTERSMARLSVVVPKARHLRDLGFRLALDDTGAGNAGLEMLSQLPVDFVKIDRTVVANALVDKTAHSVLVGIIAIAREVGSYVIAEGIENAEMLDLVQQVGVQGMQGYLLGSPSETIPDATALQSLNPLGHGCIISSYADV
jgi:diguanylate cyclase (GGDEF)-like protein